jgi:chemotaxis protein methyltransferase WspC
MHAASPQPDAPRAAEACRLAESLLERWIGLDSQTVGSGAIARAVRMRMDACGESDEGAFLARLDRDADERGRLIDEVVVPESWFFRDQQVFEFLEQLATSFARTSRPSPLRVLCVPCAAGEEPYSVAMALLEAGLSADQFRRAAAATYSANAFRAHDIGFRDRWFRDRGTAAELDEGVRRQVHFSWGNLLDESFGNDRAPYDIVFCRNLLIYLTPEARGRVERMLDRLLTPDGVLVLGAAEPAILRGSWRPVADTTTCTLRRGSAPADRLPRPVRPSPRGGPASSTVFVATGVSPAGVPPTVVPASPALANEAVASRPVTLDEVLQRAGSLVNAGRHAEALALCQRHQHTAGPSARVYFLMGMLHQTAGELEQAESCLQKTLYLDSNHDEAYLALALIASRRGDEAAAEKHRQCAARILARKEAT